MLTFMFYFFAIVSALYFGYLGTIDWLATPLLLVAGLSIVAIVYYRGANSNRISAGRLAKVSVLIALVYASFSCYGVTVSFAEGAEFLGMVLLPLVFCQVIAMSFWLWIAKKYWSYSR